MGSFSRFPTKMEPSHALARRAAPPSVIRMSDGLPRLSNRTTSSFPLGSTKWKRRPSEKEETGSTIFAWAKCHLSTP
jgi:hypothetical protein